MPPQGLAKAQPGGTLQHTANAAFLVLSAVEAGVFPAAKFMLHACWVRNQIGYMLVSGPASSACLSQTHMCVSNRPLALC